MKPPPQHPRIRKTIKWVRGGGAVVTVLLVVVWIGSGWYRASYCKGGTSVSVEGGGLDLLHMWEGPCANIGWSSGWITHDLGWSWRLWVDSSDVVFGYWIVPIWMPTAALALVTTIAWRLDTLARRRAKLNLCPKCNYDRTGLAAGAVCPECGVGAASPTNL